MNLFYMLTYKGVPLAYTLTQAEAMALVDNIPLSLDWEKIWANSPKDLCLPHSSDIHPRVWQALKEIDLNKLQEME